MAWADWDRCRPVRRPKNLSEKGNRWDRSDFRASPTPITTSAKATQVDGGGQTKPYSVNCRTSTSHRKQGNWLRNKIHWSGRLARKVAALPWERGSEFRSSIELHQSLEGPGGKAPEGAPEILVAFSPLKSRKRLKNRCRERARRELDRASAPGLASFLERAHGADRNRSSPQK